MAYSNSNILAKSLSGNLKFVYVTDEAPGLTRGFILRKKSIKMECIDRKKQINIIIVAVSLVGVAGLFVNVANMTIMLISCENIMIINLALYMIACILGFVLIPYFFVHKVICGEKMPKCKVDLKRVVLVVAIIVLIIVLNSEKSALIHNLIIATSEEILFRYIMLGELESCFDKKYAYIIGSLIFALILHMNGDFLVNVLTKIPASLLLYYIADKYGIQDSIFIHWSYNSLIGYFIN